MHKEWAHVRLHAPVHLDYVHRTRSPCERRQKPRRALRMTVVRSSLGHLAFQQHVSSHLRVTLKQLAIRSTLIDTSTISLSTGSKNTTVIILPLSSSFRLHPTATADVTLTNHLHIPRPVLSCSTHVQHMVYLLERYRSTTSSVHSSLLYL